jgi:hypothetical protein
MEGGATAMIKITNGHYTYTTETANVKLFQILTDNRWGFEITFKNGKRIHPPLRFSSKKKAHEAAEKEIDSYLK